MAQHQIKKISGNDGIEIKRLLNTCLLIETPEFDKIIDIFHKHKISALFLIQGRDMVKKIIKKDKENRRWLYDSFEKSNIGITPVLEKTDFLTVSEINASLKSFILKKVE